MRNHWIIAAAVAVLAVMVVASTFTYAVKDGALQTNDTNDTLFQAGTLQGLYDGQFGQLLTVGEGLANGNTGMGGFTGMDGEMIVLDGVCYQVTIDGVVHLAPAETGTPYMLVGDYAPESTISISTPTNKSSLLSSITSNMTNPNAFHIIVIRGTFTNITVRSVPFQVEPYPPLLDVVANQSVFFYNNIQGSIVAIYAPFYVGTVDTVGYHMHFISDDLSKGGHVMDLNLVTAEIGLDKKNELRLVEPMLPPVA